MTMSSRLCVQTDSPLPIHGAVEAFSWSEKGIQLCEVMSPVAGAIVSGKRFHSRSTASPLRLVKKTTVGRIAGSILVQLPES